MAKRPKSRRRLFAKSGLILMPSEPAFLKRYYARESLSCTLSCGGRLEPVRVQMAGSEGGKALFECQSCSLRYEMEIPPATRTERRKVKEAIEDGKDPDCPRHGEGQRLLRVRSDLVCPLCGVAYARV